MTELQRTLTVNLNDAAILLNHGEGFDKLLKKVKNWLEWKSIQHIGIDSDESYFDTCQLTQVDSECFDLVFYGKE